MLSVGLLILSLILCSLSHAGDEKIYYITTSSSTTDLCTHQSCLNLSQFAANSNRLLHSNTTVTLVFLPGTHYLTKLNLTLSYNYSDSKSFAMKSENSTAQIKCTNDSHVHFSYMKYIRITNLEFIGCGGNQGRFVETLLISDTKFEGKENSKTALQLTKTTAQIVNSSFVSNTHGAIIAINSTIDISQGKFEYNKADYGGAIYAKNSIIKMSGVFTTEANHFLSNSASVGGVMHLLKSSITIEASAFHSNSASRYGGVLYSSYSNITVVGSIFSESISPEGAVFYVLNSKVKCQSFLLISNNSANCSAVMYFFDSEFSGHNVTFSNNLRSLMAFNSNITLSGSATFVNNQSPQKFNVSDVQEGGALTLLRSRLYFDGASINLEHNRAESGGAIRSADSRLYVNGNVTIAHNTATRNGGGIYLFSSHLFTQQKSTSLLFNNTAFKKGGGLHAISSSIQVVFDFLPYKCTSSQKAYEYIGARITFTGNRAKLGGGLSLEANAKVSILKYKKRLTLLENNFIVLFAANSAEYGGAVYVNDETNSGTCSSDLKIECFLQVLAIYHDYCNISGGRVQTHSVYFSDNNASIGSTLYGGLLDRCAVSQFAEVHKNNASNDIVRGGGIAYFMNITNATWNNSSISSLPVRIRLCNNSEHSCIDKKHISVKKGEAFTVLLAAIDLVGKPVSSTIQTSLNSTESGLAQGQLTRKIHAAWTNLTFNIVSPHTSENLTLFALDGPCYDAELSSAVIQIHFLPCSCPVGLKESGINATNCTCECNTEISQYVEFCDSQTGLLIKQSNTRAWISFTNGTNQTGYLVYPNCPFDYCLTDSPHIYLNHPNGADAQCAFNRSSLLCGSCQTDLSLSLGSSRCLPCPVKSWPIVFVSITIAAVLAGIALVTLLLLLNMTVAVGTINGLIFYANIVDTNKSILLPFQETNFVTVFISLLNLELGIDVCYFPGMDTYNKMWLQLVFPAYVIVLVILIIIFSSYSTKFSNLIGKMDPVATLATLILLSYAKLIEVCFKSLSRGTVEYPDGSSKMVWLPDATVNYLSGKHIPMFIAAVLILLSGLAYTALLFSWQWLLYLPKWRIFTWSRNPKIQTFIETYHKPYTPKHRYWTGLLLIARVVLYLVASINVTNDPTIALLSISLVLGLLIYLRGFIGSRVYRKWPADLLETLLFLKLFLFAIFSWYSLNDDHFHQKIIAYTLVTILALILLLIIIFHVYSYTLIFSSIKKTRLGKTIDRLFSATDPKPKPRQHHFSPPPPDEDIHRFDELLNKLDCPVYTDDYDSIPLINSVRMQPTYSVVEVHQPHLAAPDYKGTSAQMPADSIERGGTEVK